MAVILADTSVLVDVIVDDRRFGEASSSALAACAARADIVINQIVYGELAAAFERVEEVEDRLGRLALFKMELPWDAAFLAGQAFRIYRRQGGPRDTLLPDLLIGAHAAVAGFSVLTRDPRRIRNYFPTVEIIEP